MRGQARIIDLEHESGIDNRRVFFVHRVGEGDQVLLFGCVVEVRIMLRHIGW